MKKLFTLLTMLIVAISTSWADETLFDVDFSQVTSEEIKGSGSSAEFVAKTYQGYDMSFGVKSDKKVNMTGSAMEFSSNNLNAYSCIAIPLTVTANKQITVTVTLASAGKIKYEWKTGALPSTPPSLSGTTYSTSSTTNTFEYTPTGTSCVLYLGRSGSSDGSKTVTRIVITQESASEAPTTPTLTVDGGDVIGASTTTIASTNAQKIYYCWNNSSAAPAKDAEETWTEVTGNSYEYTIPNVTASGMYLHAYGWNTVNTSDIKTSNAFNVTKTKLDAGLEYATTALTKGVGDSDFTNELTNPHNLDVTYSVVEGATATGVEVDATTGEVTVGTVTGTATIKATFAGNDDYNADEATYDLTVAEYRYVSYDGNGADSGDVPEQQQYTPGATATTAKSAGTLTKAGYTVVGWNTQADGQGTSYGFNSTFTMGSEDVTLYAVWGENYYTFTPKTVTEDEAISTLGVEILNSTNGTMTLAGKKNDTSVKYTTAGLSLGGGGADSVRVALDANMIAGSVIVINMQAAGTGSRGLKLNKDGKTTVATLGWTNAENGDIATFTYTVTSTDGLAGKNWFCLQRNNSVAIKSVVVTNVPTSETITPAKEYTTFSSTMALDFSAVEGLEAYAAVSAASGKVVMTKVTDIPANTGLVLKKTGTDDSYNVPVGTATSLGVDNKLVAATTATAIEAYNPDNNVFNYILKNGEFHPANAGTLAAGKAYLHLEASAGQQGLVMEFDDTPTAVEAVQEVQEFKSSKVQKVIKNGQLFIGNYTVAGARVK